jgi:hypothetical protein
MEDSKIPQPQRGPKSSTDVLVQRAQIVISALGAALALHLASSSVVGSIRSDIHDLALRVTAVEVGIAAAAERGADYRMRISEIEKEQNERLKEIETELKGK